MTDDLKQRIAQAQAAYNALSPAEKAWHDHEQRRSFVRGMCPSNYDYDKWSKIVDETIPPLPHPNERLRALQWLRDYSRDLREKDGLTRLADKFDQIISTLEK